jgi:glycosyltransferase involved in cell wall biosynthesis
MKITVIVCTYNRCHTLAQALNSLAAQTMPEPVEWEVLVVDNNSSDQTGEVVKDFCRRHPSRFRYLFQPQSGKSHALNMAIREARGDVLAFTDDDVAVDPIWLYNLTAPLDDDNWAGVGGRTFPGQPFSPPRWLSIEEPYNLGGALCALFDLGDKPCELRRAPYGTNMAFRKAMFEKYGGFRLDLGPSPNRDIPRPNEDTEFGRRLMAAGEHLRYEPSALVTHPVPEDRVKKEFFLTWWFDYGRAGAREIGKRPDICGIPRHYFTLLKTGTLLAVARMPRWILTLNPKLRFYRKCFAWKSAGEIAELYRRSFESQKTETMGSVSV